MLVLGVVGFYMFDSAMLLYSNELAYVQINGRWSFVYPESRRQILGKNPYIPNLLSPDSPLFRVCWSVSMSSEQHEGHEALQRFLGALNLLRHFTIVLFALLIVGLPIVLFGFGTGFGFLMLLGFVYITISGMLIQTYRQREELGLSIKAFAKLAFDSLVCAPFALNLVRKITVRRPLAGDPIKLAHQIFDDATFSRLVGVLCNRVDEELEFEDKESPRYEALKDYKNQLTSMAS
jgi:hypothetical protein